MTNRRQLSANNATTLLSADVSPFDVQLTVRDGSRFPQPGINEFFLITLDNGVDIEIVEVTNRVGNTLSGLARAQEKTSAAYFAAGSRVEVRVTAGYLSSIEDLKDDVRGLSASAPSLSNVTRLVFSDIPDDKTPRGLTWNNTEQTVDITLGSTEVVLQVGQEILYRVRNNSGQLLANGTCVMAVGTVGNSGRILVAPALASGLYEGKYFMGIVTENIANGADGFVTHFGKVRGIPTDGSSVGESWSDGDILYVHPTIAGQLTKVKPSIPNEIVTMAIVLNANTSNGTLVVRPTIDSHLASVAKYIPAAGPAISVQDKLRYFDATIGNPTVVGGSPNGVAYLDSSQVLRANTALQFDGSSLGVGTAPSATTYPFLQGAENFTIGSKGLVSNYVSNVVYNNGWRYLSINKAALYKQSSGTHSWHVAQEGTIGSVASFSPVMSLDSSGLLNLASLSASKVVFTDTAKNLTSNGVVDVSQGGTGVSSITGLLKGNGASSFTSATAGSDYAKPDTTSIWSSYQVHSSAIHEARSVLSGDSIDLRAAGYFSKTITANTTFSVLNVPNTGTAVTFLLDLTNGGSFSITWWSGVKWSNGLAPSLTASGRDVLGFFTHDGGITWSGLVIGRDLK